MKKDKSKITYIRDLLRNKLNALSMTYMSAFLLLGCATSPISIEEGQLNFPEFSTFPSPRVFDGPGTVFRVGKSNIKYPVTILDVDVENVGSEKFLDSKQLRAWDLNAFANYLGADDIVEDAEASTGTNGTLKFSISLNGGERHRTYDTPVLKSLERSDIQYLSDYKYYVVREAISVKAIEYDVIKNSELSSGVKLALKKIVDSKIGLNWKDDSEQSMKERFDEPHFVFYKVDEILPPGLGVNADKGLKLYELSQEEMSKIFRKEQK